MILPRTMTEALDWMARGYKTYLQGLQQEDKLLQLIGQEKFNVGSRVAIDIFTKAGK